MTMRKLLAVVQAAALAVGLAASSASAHPTPEPDCRGETHAVVSAAGDVAMAELIASWQVLDTKCVVAPDEAKALIDGQQVVVLGGTKAVPESAVAGLNVIVRLAGTDRLDTARKVLAWIDNRGEATSDTTPAAVSPAAVSAGTFHSCGLRADGTAVCWGSNRDGRADAPSGKFVDVSAGTFHSCGLRADGTAVCWGFNRDGEADAPSGKFVAVSAGSHHSCGVRADGTAVCWGWNLFGQADAPSGKFAVS